MKNGLYFSSGLIVYSVVTGLLSATSRAKAKKTADVLVFSPIELVRWLLIIEVPAFACAAIYVYVTPPRSLLGAFIFGFIAIAGALAFPSSLLITTDGITEIKWWGARKTILWRDVSRLTYRKGLSAIAVVSKDGNRIAHSGWNRDSKGFLTLCEEKTGLVAQASKL